MQFLNSKIERICPKDAVFDKVLELYCPIVKPSYRSPFTLILPENPLNQIIYMVPRLRGGGTKKTNCN
jgi:hypothetical protein